MSIFGLIELLTVVIYMEMRYLSIFGGEAPSRETWAQVTLVCFATVAD